ncbi:MAG: YraN family protein [Brooklawnia sp.]|nr:YraN family protein [Brooklawnia sp.]
MTKAIDRAALARGLGGWGEDAAAEHLVALGWQVVVRNWRGEGGEIDLVALEPVDDRPPVGVIVEVKCRSGLGFGDPLESITWAKCARLRRLARQWRQTYPGPLSAIRVDAIGIVKITGQRPRITHARGIQ